MTATKSAERPRVSGTAVAGSLHRAWTSVALIPVFVVFAFAFGYGVYDVLGYQPENDDAPFWVDLVGTVLILTVALAPCAGAVIFGRRARDGDDRRGVVPLGLGALAGVGLTAISVVTLIGSW